MIADANDPRLDELLLRWEELHEQGQSLSAAELCSTCPELAGELARRIALLRRMDPLLGDTTTDPDAPAPAAPACGSGRVSATARADFRDLRFHAAGGLGEVFMARNAELNREVALKFLKPERSRDPDSLRRFLQEAEVTGRLEHPGIVPIYALGTDGSGAPCYAMRFIRGQTLQDPIDAFHAAEKTGRDPSERSLALRELLNRFVSICSTMAYAHSRGILHRDLKPRNVMLGKYDETLVVDWGLAKAFDRDEAARSVGEETLTPSSGSGSGSDAPTAGVVGTPAYMSPEQAEAKWELVGPASDIFGLGAILYAILTGRAPYQGQTIGEVLENVKRCEFPAPRQIKPGVSRALEAVCLKAMALEPEHRYATAIDLAADIRRWLADEPVSAWREPFSIRARRWVRRHRTPVTGVAATMLVGLVALGMGYWRVSTLNNRLSERNEQLRLAKADSDQRLDQTLRAIEDYYSGISQELLLGQKEFQGLRARLLEKPRQFYEELTRDLESTTDERGRSLLARGRDGLGRIMALLGRHEEARREDEAAIELYLKLVGSRPGDPNYSSALAKCYANLGKTQATMGDWAQATDSFHDSVAITSSLVATHPDVADYWDGLARGLSSLGNAQNRTGDIPGAVESHRKAVEAATKPATAHPDIPEYQNRLRMTYTNFGIVLSDTGDHRAAAQAYREAVAIGTRLTREHPGVPDYQFGLSVSSSNLGIEERETGDYKGADRSLRRAIELLARLAAAQPNVPDYQDGLAMGYNSLSFVQNAIGDRRGAIESLRRAIECGAALVAAQPGVPDYAYGLGESYNNLGLALQAAGDHSGAIGPHRQAVAWMTKLVESHPKRHDYPNVLARSYTGLGFAQANAGDNQGAAEPFRRAIEIATELVTAQPDIADYQFGLAYGYSGYAEVQNASGDRGGAAKSLHGAITIYSQLVVSQPNMPSYQEHLAESYVNLGNLEREMGQSKDAEVSTHRAIEIATKLAETHPDSPDCSSLLGAALDSFGHVLSARDRHVDAERAYRQAIDRQSAACAKGPEVSEYREKLSSHYVGLVGALVALGRSHEAVRVARQNRAACKTNANEFYNAARGLALCVPITGDAVPKPDVATEAVQALKAAVAAGWKDARKTSGDLDLVPLHDRDDFRQLVAELFDRTFPANAFAP